MRTDALDLIGGDTGDDSDEGPPPTGDDVLAADSPRLLGCTIEGVERGFDSGEEVVGVVVVVVEEEEEEEVATMGSDEAFGEGDGGGGGASWGGRGGRENDCPSSLRASHCCWCCWCCVVAAIGSDSSFQLP
jgi:hypothetical protein